MLKFVQIAIAFIFISTAAVATECPQHFFEGHAPKIVHQEVKEETRELCYEQFAVLHSGLTRTALYAAEHLTAERLQGPGPERVNAFHVEKKLPKDHAATLDDYRGSGYDRGHLAPSADMTTPSAQYESFSLANMIPQVPESNRGDWREIEEHVRDLAEKMGELYVVSGPIFDQNPKMLKGRVVIPAFVYKIVYDPNTNKGAAYLVKNSKENSVRIVPISEITRLTGLVYLENQETVSQMRLDNPTVSGK